MPSSLTISAPPFLGGFLLALSMQRWGLERRIARIALRAVGTEPTRVVGGFMVTNKMLEMIAGKRRKKGGD